MEMKSIIDATRKFIKKYQYIFLIIVTGFLLLIIPSQKTKQTVSSVPIQPTELKTDDLECDLSVLLSKICGAG